jgi:molybdopterin-guanine dinucleotide biosynthesis protein A
MPDVTLAILAGGGSRRFGEPKQRARWRGRWLLQELVERWRPAAARIVLAGPREMVEEDAGALHVDTVFDSWPDCGPLAGIHAALDESPGDRVFFLPCDMPLAPVAALAAFSALLGDEDDGVMLQRGGISVPVCALYRRRLAGPIAEAAAAGRTKITRALGPARIISLDEAGLRAAGLDPRDFAAFNTPEELREIFP